MSNIKTVLDETPFQTAGPFLHIGCLPNLVNIRGVIDKDLGVIPFVNKSYHNLITITGSVFDGDGQALDDIMLKLGKVMKMDRILLKVVLPDLFQIT